MTRRPILALLGVGVAIALFGLLSWNARRAWPYPVILPTSFSFHDNTYHRDSTCRSLANLSRHRLHQVGTLPSIVFLGGRAIYSYTLTLSFSRTYDWVWVRDDDCYRLYAGDKQL